jgi:hypothetical protein
VLSCSFVALHYETNIARGQVAGDRKMAKDFSVIMVKSAIFA